MTLQIKRLARIYNGFLSEITHQESNAVVRDDSSGGENDAKYSHHCKVEIHDWVFREETEQ